MLTVDVKIPASLEEKIRAMGKLHGSVKVGIFPDATYAGVDESGDAIPVASVAYLNEYGGGHNPERPFFRRTIKEHAKKWVNGIAYNIKEKGINEESVLRAFEMAGIVAVGDVKRTIQKWPIDDPPNSPATIQIKRNRAYGNKKRNLAAITPETVLIDTGTMISSINYEVEK